MDARFVQWDLHDHQPDECAALLVGAAAGSDVADLIRARVFDKAGFVLVGGREPLRSVYTNLLRETLPSSAGRVESVDDSTAAIASAIGALEIARLATVGLA